MPGKQVKNWPMYEELRGQGFSKQSAARITNSHMKRSAAAKKGHKTRRKSVRSSWDDFHMLCEDDNPILAGPCQSQGRWVGPDGKVRCSLHHIQRFGHSEPLVRSPNYEPPPDAPAPEPAPEPEPAPAP